MNVRRPHPLAGRFLFAQRAVCGLTILAALLMVIPVSTALVAGIASVSLVLFGVAALLLVGLLVSGVAGPRMLVSVTLVVALCGALIPQLALLRVATNVGASLAFDPVSYLTFSGDTSISPTKTLPYKTLSNGHLELAVYSPRETEQRPAVLLLHGGGWRYGSHLETGEWPKTLIDAGFSVISIEYRLSSDTYHTWRDAPADVHDAVMYVQKHAAELNIDPTRLTLFGQSAGGHLALLEAYRFQTVSSVIALYAPIDLSLDYRTSRDKSAELDFVGGPPGQYPDRYRALSPATYVTGDSPRTLLVQGKSDDLVAPANATRMSALLARRAVDHTLVLLPLTGHSFENQRGGFATQIARQQALTFLTR